MKSSYKFVVGRRKSFPKTIELQIYGDFRLYISTRISIDPKNWDETKQVIKEAEPNAIFYNKFLSDMKAKIEEAEFHCNLRGIPFTAKRAKAALTGDNADASEELLVANVRRYNDIELRKGIIKEATHTKYNTLANTLEKFIKETTKAKDMKLISCNTEWLDNLEIWLRQIYEPNTIVKFHRTLKKYFGFAIRDRFITVNPYDGFVSNKRVHAKARAVLSEDELHRLEELDREQMAKVDTRLILVLDMFLLSCYCGLRIGDCCSLKRDEIKSSPDGLVIDKITEKMDGKRVILPLRSLFNGKGEAIVQRYLKENADSEMLFPYIPEPKINIRLKTIALLGGISQNLTFHVARHTCATLLAEKTGNPFLIMQILGHSDIKTSMIYIHNSYSATVNTLKNVRW